MPQPTPQDYANALRSQQMQQQQQLANAATPTSTAGILGNADAYNKYVEDAMVNGQQPMTRQQFLQMIQQSQMR